MRLMIALLAVATAAYAAPPVKCVLDKGIQEQILNFHNQKRERVAKGLEGNFGPAKNMYKLKWSCRLERLAKKYSQQCLDRTDKFMGLGSYGASLVRALQFCYWKFRYINSGFSPNPKEAKDFVKLALDEWWKPAQQHYLRPDNRYPGPHFATAANIINSETTQVGCSYSDCPIFGKPEKLGILCLYDDIGYLEDRVLYDSGDYCKKNKDCTTYRGSKSLVASGEAEDKLIKNGKGFAPKAANMRKLEYDCKLEEMAEKYARACVDEHSSKESRMISGEEAGENIFTISVYDADYIKAAEWATRAWFRELKDHGVDDGTNNICRVRNGMTDKIRNTFLDLHNDIRKDADANNFSSRI
ncbi:SCP-like protein [Ancylostoma duodenale]|uniref:SCP-like protein n=1 Tax=Ancylostoma duodenale TaxID=51022 RepID=A0A0C2CSZ5_9BILA|nr:SCP-like protein [Ancylostoma duodenale]